MIRTIYIAPFIGEDTDLDGNTIKKYDTPFPLEVSLNSLSGSVELTEYATKIKRMCKAMPNLNDYIGKIHEEDKAYLYGATPAGESNNGDNANYRVDAILPQNVKMIVYFERL